MGEARKVGSDNVKSKKDVFEAQKKTKKESPLCCIDGHVSS